MPEFYYFSDSSSEGGYTPRHGEEGGDDDSVVMDDPVDGPPDDDDDLDGDRDLEEVDPTLLPWYERPPVYRDIPNTWLRDGNQRYVSQDPSTLGRVMAFPLGTPLTGGRNVAETIDDVDCRVFLNPVSGNPANRLTTAGEPVYITVPVWSHLSVAPLTPYVITMKFKIRQTAPGPFDLSIGEPGGFKVLGISSQNAGENTVEISVDPSLDVARWESPGIKAIVLQIDLLNQIGDIPGDVELYDIILNVPWNDSITQEWLQGSSPRIVRSATGVDPDSRDLANKQWSLIQDGGDGIRCYGNQYNGSVEVPLTNGNYEWSPGVVMHGDAAFTQRDGDLEVVVASKGREGAKTHMLGQPHWDDTGSGLNKQRGMTSLNIKGGDTFGCVIQGIALVKIVLNPAEAAAQVAAEAAALAEATALAAAEAAVVAILLADMLATRAASDAAEIIYDTAQGQYDNFRGQYDLDPSNFNANRLQQAQLNLDSARNSFNELDAIADSTQQIYTDRISV
jgi:hypothetical protein